MDVIKTSSNVEFDVIYADGTRRRVEEGVLHEAVNGEIIFHNGTSRPEVIIAAAEDILKTLKSMGAGLALLTVKMYLTTESCETLRDLAWFADDLLNNSSAEKQGIFRLGQMDMKESIADMLRDSALQRSSTVIRAALLEASRMVREMEVPGGGAPVENT